MPGAIAPTAAPFRSPTRRRWCRRSSTSRCRRRRRRRSTPTTSKASPPAARACRRARKTQRAARRAGPRSSWCWSPSTSRWSARATRWCAICRRPRRCSRPSACRSICAARVRERQDLQGDPGRRRRAGGRGHDRQHVRQAGRGAAAALRRAQRDRPGNLRLDRAADAQHSRRPARRCEFRSRLASPPAEASDVLVRFFTAQDAVAGAK